MRKVVGVDLGGTNIVSAVVNEKGKVLGRDKRPTLISKGPARVIRRIAEGVRAAVDLSGSSWSSIRAVGVGSPGPLSPKRGVVLDWRNGGWRNVPLGLKLQQHLKKPVFIENDANVAALGEAWAGAGRGEKVVLCLTLGTGVGGGLILDGKIFQGAWDVGCEIGHIVVHPEGPVHNTGNRGELEQYASATGIARIARELGIKNRRGGPLQAHMVQDMARAGNRRARKVYEIAGRYLGIGLTSAIYILNPSMILFAGGASGARELIFKPMHRELKKRCLPASLRGVKFRLAKLGDNMGVVGAARLAFQHLERRSR